MKETYKGIEITYHERTNDWRFELRSRERIAESLINAKKIIDKPEPKEKAPFNKVEAWKLGYSNEPESVTVTSLAAGASWETTSYVWVTNGKSRAKERSDSVFPKGKHNNDLIAEIIRTENEIGKLNQLVSALKNRLRPMFSKGADK